MLARERPEIVSVATQPEQRAEIVIHAAGHGARAIYAEKAMAASLQQADAMVAAVERHGVVFNMGTNRRWDTPYDTMKELIHGGRYGSLRSMTIHQEHGLFNMGSHGFDLLLWLNDDQPVEWVQFHLAQGGDDLADGRAGQRSERRRAPAVRQRRGRVRLRQRPPVRGRSGVRTGGDQLTSARTTSSCCASRAG